MAVGQIGKSVIKYATPLDVGADLAQAGLEWAGHKEVGKAVGVTGNIAAGALMGAPFGTPRAALGALGGFAIWGMGEVIDGLVDRAFGDKEKYHSEHRVEECGHCAELEDQKEQQLAESRDKEEQHNEPGNAEEQQHNEA